MIDNFIFRLLIFAGFLSNNFYTVSQDIQSSNLPIISITAPIIGSEFKENAEMTVFANEEGSRNNLTDAPVFQGKIGIETRGSSSLYFYPKKSYSFGTRSESGENLDTTLLGLPSENDWILYAPYGDKSLMRDVLAYHLGNKTGNYAPKTRYCELLINNEYMGVYVLIERIKRDKNRVNIEKVEDKKDADLTGGYILNIDRETTPDKGWKSTRSGATYNFVYPEGKDITDKQREYIQEYIEEFEKTMSGSKFNDPIEGYSKYIDVPSFIDFIIISEVSRNVDGYRLSTYLHKDKGGKLKAGPIWDYNLGFGNANYCQGESTDGWAVNFTTACPEDVIKVPFWWVSLSYEAKFVDLLKERWKALRQSVLKTEEIHHFIDSTAAILDESQKRNFQKWPILGIYVWPNPVWPHTYAGEVDYLKSWITSRMAWIDKEMSSITPIDNSPSINTNFTAYPNPFHKQITFKYPSVGKTPTLKIINMVGQAISTLTPSGKDENTYRWTWDGTANGNAVSEGFYMVSLEVEGKITLRQKIYKQF